MKKARKTLSFVLVSILLLTLIPVFSVAAVNAGTYEAPYGSPTVDGQIDDVWDKAEWGAIDKVLSNKPLAGKAQFKILWDDTYLYILLQHEDANIDKTATWNDFSRILVDEQRDKTLTNGQNADWMLSAIVDGNDTSTFNIGSWGTTSVTDMAFRVVSAGGYTEAEDGKSAVINYEIRLELVTAPVENRQLGFDISYTERPQEATACWNYDPQAGDRADRWSWSIIAQNYENVGVVVLIKDAEQGTTESNSPVTTEPITSESNDPATSDFDSTSKDSESESQSSVQDTTTPDTSGDDTVKKEGLSTGAVIGIVAGAIVLAFVVVMILKKKRT